MFAWSWLLDVEVHSDTQRRPSLLASYNVLCGFVGHDDVCLIGCPIRADADLQLLVGLRLVGVEFRGADKRADSRAEGLANGACARRLATNARKSD